MANKQDLIAKVAEYLSKGEKVQLIGFGNF